jgi:D-alanyl-D-alanine carboxypeptidase
MLFNGIMHTFKNITFCLYIFCILFFWSKGFAQPSERKLKKKIEHIVEKHFVPSLSLQISSPEQSFSLSFHHPEAEQQQIYGIGSTTKMLSAVLFFHYLENDEVSLEHTLDRFLSDDVLSHPGWKNIRLGQLLQHTSGLSDYTKHPDWIRGVIDGKAPQSFDDKLALVSPERKNEGQFSYSNTHYLLLEKVIRVLSGKSYQEAFNDFYSEHGLSEIILQDPEGLKGFFAQQEKQISDVSHWQEYYGYDGGAYATAEAMQAFQEKLFVDKSLLSEESLKQMQDWISMEPTTIPVGEGSILQYGYGLMKLDYQGQPWIGHAGGTLKYQSFVFYQPETQTSVSLLTNCSGQYYNRVFYNKLLPLVLEFYGDNQ